MTDMMMDRARRPAGLARATQNLLGQPIPRVEGPAKVTGTATYAYEAAPDGTAYAAIVGTPIGSGRVTRIDTSAAEALSGVIAIIHDDPRIVSGGSNSQAQAHSDTDTIFHSGRPVAIVVAEDQVIAREAAGLVVVHTEPGQNRFDRDAQPVQTDHGIGFLPAIDIGDLDSALADAEAALDQSYTTPVHFPAALEPHATTAWWEDGKLTVRTSNQVIGGARLTTIPEMGHALPAAVVTPLAAAILGLTRAA